MNLHNLLQRTRILPDGRWKENRRAGDVEGLNHDGGSSYTNHYLQYIQCPLTKGGKKNQVDRSARQLGDSVNERGSAYDSSTKREEEEGRQVRDSAFYMCVGVRGRIHVQLPIRFKLTASL